MYNDTPGPGDPETYPRGSWPFEEDDRDDDGSYDDYLAEREEEK